MVQKKQRESRPKFERLMIQVSSPQMEYLRSQSEKLGISHAELVRRILDEHLERRDRQGGMISTLPDDDCSVEFEAVPDDRGPPREWLVVKQADDGTETPVRYVRADDD